MTLAPEAHAQAEAFFRDFTGLEALRLPHVRFFHGWVIDFLLRSVLKVGALTLGHCVFVCVDNLSREDAGRRTMTDGLLMHELMHVVQYEQAGRWRFLWVYAREYARGLWQVRGVGAEARMRAYLGIRYEREARAAESAYHVWRVAGACAA